MIETGYDNNKKEFLKSIEKLALKKNKYDVFKDWLEMTALSYDIAKTKEKEERFGNIISKYSKNEVEVLADSVGNIVMGYSDENKRGDFLGECYHELLLNDKKGKAQVFTPYDLSYNMALLSLVSKEQVQKFINEKGYITVYDPACGAGCLLIACFFVLKEWGFNPQTQALFIGADLDNTCCLMCYDQLSVLGASAIIDNMNTLTLERFNRYLTGMYLLNKKKFIDEQGITKMQGEPIQNKIKDKGENKPVQKEIIIGDKVIPQTKEQIQLSFF